MLWKSWGLYVVSYLTSDGTPPANGRLEALQRTLEDMSMRSATVCAGYNALSEGRPQTEKVWLTHTAAIRRHAASDKADMPCLVLEDDCEFLTDADTLNARVARMLEKRPDYDMINLGALPLGLTILIGSGLAICQSPILTQSVVYSPDFCQRFVANNQLLAAPEYGEGLHALPFSKRLIASPPLTTQSVWPRTAVPFKRLSPSFRALHLHIYTFSAYAAPPLAAAAVAGVVAGGVVMHRGNPAVGRAVVALSLVVFCVVLVLVLAPNLGMAHGVAADPRNRTVMQAVADDDGFLDDFCP